VQDLDKILAEERLAQMALADFVRGHAVCAGKGTGWTCDLCQTALVTDADGAAAAEEDDEDTRSDSASDGARGSDSDAEDEKEATEVKDLPTTAPAVVVLSPEQVTQFTAHFTTDHAALVPKAVVQDTSSRWMLVRLMCALVIGCQCQPNSYVNVSRSAHPTPLSPLGVLHAQDLIQALGRLGASTAAFFVRSLPITAEERRLDKWISSRLFRSGLELAALDTDRSAKRSSSSPASSSPATWVLFCVTFGFLFRIFLIFSICYNSRYMYPMAATPENRHGFSYPRCHACVLIPRFLTFF
jgi:hypothetical protein